MEPVPSGDDAVGLHLEDQLGGPRRVRPPDRGRAAAVLSSWSWSSTSAPAVSAGCSSAGSPVPEQRHDHRRPGGSHDDRLAPDRRPTRTIETPSASAAQAIAADGRRLRPRRPSWPAHRQARDERRRHLLRRASGPSATSTSPIPPNAVTAFIGPSGCGKSTILRCFNRMNDLIPGARVEGTVTLDGEDIMAPDVQPVEVRRRVGLVFQRPNPFPMSIYENVAYGPRRHGVKDKAAPRRDRRALAPPGGDLGRGQGRLPEEVRPVAVRAASSSGCASPGPWRPTRGDPDGRAVLGARPDRDPARSRS